MGDFIGMTAVKQIAEKLEPNIVMGPAFFSKDELKRLGIKVITGVQFKQTVMVLNRKGGTSRRKVVGTPISSKIGYLTERTMVAHLVWNRFKHNEDDFQEKPIQINGGAQFHYPLAEEFITEIGKEFSDDLYANLFFGEEDGEDETLNFFDGFQTIINKDIENGDISVANGNLIPCDALSAPSKEGDSAAWDIIVAWIDKWPAPLKRVPVNLYCSIEYGHHIADAYAQKHRCLKEVDYIADANGNFKVMEYPKITFVPSDDFGKGTRMFVTTENTLEFGINGDGQDTYVGVQHGSDDDMKDIIFQIQTCSGCRVKNIVKSNFVTNGGVIQNVYVSGDYTKDAVYALPNDPALGSVAISNGGTPVESGTEVAKGTTLTLTATPKGSATFKKWSNGATANPTTIVTTGDPMGVTALFEADSSSSD